MKYYRVVMNDELEHSGMSKNDPRYNNKRPVDMQKALSEFYNKYNDRLGSYSWEDLKSLAVRYMQGMLGGTGLTEFMKSSTYNQGISDLYQKWQKARGIRKNSYGR